MNPTTIYNIVSLISAILCAISIHRYYTKQRSITAQLYTLALNQQVILESMYIHPSLKPRIDQNTAIIYELHKQLIIDADD